MKKRWPYYPCPLRIAVHSCLNKDRVSVIHTERVIYRRSDGTYYIRIGGLQFTVVLSGHGFLLTISAENWFQCFPRNSKDLLTHVASEPKQSAEEEHQSTSFGKRKAASAVAASEVRQ